MKISGVHLFGMVALAIVASCGERRHQVTDAAKKAESSKVVATAPSLRGRSLIAVLAVWKAPYRRTSVSRFEYVRAQITEAQWLQIRQQLEENWTPGKGYMPHWGWLPPEEKPEWWDPTDSTSHSFWIHRGHDRQAIKYERRFLYYWEFWAYP